MSSKLICLRTCRFVPLLYQLLDSSSESVQAGALEVLTEIASKRMDAEAKLRLLQQLGLVSRAASWQLGLPGSEDSSVPLKAVRLLATLCTGLFPPQATVPDKFLISPAVHVLKQCSTELNTQALEAFCLASLT